MKKSIASYFEALVQVLRGRRDGAAIGKAIVALLAVGVVLLGLSVATLRVGAACVDYFGLEEIELPLLCTDANAYAPGESAALFGFGFAPGETVALLVTRDGVNVGEAWEALADANGEFTTTWEVVGGEGAGGVLLATAIGLTSEIEAQAVFSDSEPVGPAWRGLVDADGVTWARLRIVNDSAEDTAWIVSNCRTSIAADSDIAATDADLDWDGVVPAESEAYVWVYGLLSGSINVATAGGTVSGFYDFNEPSAAGDSEWIITVDEDGVATGQMAPAMYGLPLHNGTLPDMTIEEDVP